MSAQGNFFSGWADFLRFLDTKGHFRMVLGFERVNATLSSLGLTRPPYFVVQVVGTNGKGSTCTFASHLLAQHGLKVGTHTSPHLFSLRERITINNIQIAEDMWIQGANVLAKHHGLELTYFEFVTCLAVWLFAKHNVDIAIMETGLGGTHDATTALQAALVAFTPISLDHTSVLGNSLHRIATDKAGAIRSNTPALTAPQSPEVLHCLQKAAGKAHAPLLVCLPIMPFADKTAEAENNIASPSATPPVPPAPPVAPLLDTPSGDVPLHTTSLPAFSAHCAVPAELPIPPLVCPIKWPGQTECCATLPGTSENPCLPKLGLAGEHQFTNAALALAITRLAMDRQTPNRPETPQALSACISLSHNVQAEERGLKNAFIPGRMHKISAISLGELQTHGIAQSIAPHGLPSLLLDGGHNSAGLAALGLALARQGVAPVATIFSCMQDKDTQSLITHVRAMSHGPIFIPPIADNPRACLPHDLAQRIGLNAVPCLSMADAVTQATEHMFSRMPETFNGEEFLHPLLVCGSLYLLGDFFSLFPFLIGKH